MKGGGGEERRVSQKDGPPPYGVRVKTSLTLHCA